MGYSWKVVGPNNGIVKPQNSKRWSRVKLRSSFRQSQDGNLEPFFKSRNFPDDNV